MTPTIPSNASFTPELVGMTGPAMKTPAGAAPAPRHLSARVASADVNPASATSPYSAPIFFKDPEKYKETPRSAIASDFTDILGNIHIFLPF